MMVCIKGSTGVVVTGGQRGTRASRLWDELFRRARDREVRHGAGAQTQCGPACSRCQVGRHQAPVGSAALAVSVPDAQSPTTTLGASARQSSLESDIEEVRAVFEMQSIEAFRVAKAFVLILAGNGG